MGGVHKVRPMAGRVVRPVMAGAQAAGGFGMGLDQEARAGIFDPRQRQHFAELGQARAHQRGIAPGLVDDEGIARLRQGQIGLGGGVFRQPFARDEGDGVARLLQGGMVVEGRSGEMGFQIGGACGVVMGAGGIQRQAQRCLAQPAGKERAVGRVLHPQ